MKYNLAEDREMSAVEVTGGGNPRTVRQNSPVGQTEANT